MSQTTENQDRKAIVVFSSLSGVFAGLCCFPPIVLVTFGLAGVAFANDLGNVLYGEYRWMFRAAALALLAAGLFFYFRRSGICTLDQARRERNRILNVSLLALVTGIGIYIFWTYIVLHYWGIAAGLPCAQYDDSWAFPASTGVLGFAALLAYLMRRSQRRANREAVKTGQASRLKVPRAGVASE
jgi:NADH:ubiquinone oxidoreductase subunit 6 (subunit J)